MVVVVEVEVEVAWHLVRERRVEQCRKGCLTENPDFGI